MSRRNLTGNGITDADGISSGLKLGYGKLGPDLGARAMRERQNSGSSIRSIRKFITPLRSALQRRSSTPE